MAFSGNSPCLLRGAMDLDMTLHGSTGQDLTVPYVASPHWVGLEPPVLLLFIVYLFLFLFQLSTTDLLILMVPRASGGSGSSQAGSAHPALWH